MGEGGKPKGGFQGYMVTQKNHFTFLQNVPTILVHLALHGGFLLICFVSSVS